MLKDKKEKIKKIAKIILIVFLFLQGLVWMAENKYQYNFSNPVVTIDDRARNIHSMGTFSASVDYELKDVGKGRQGENLIVVYADKKTVQKLIITILREHLPDNLNKIKIADRTLVERTFRMSAIEYTDVPSFRFTYLLPFVRKDNLSGMGDKAIVKGITVRKQERFETAFADILYVNGEFTKVGLYKEKKGIWNYPTPVFDFKSIHDGALAFVKSKKSGKVYVCVSANGIGKYNDEEFRSFLQSFEPR